MVTLTVRDWFEAQHTLDRVDEHEARPHTHRYEVALHASGAVRDGWLVDYRVLEDALRITCAKRQGASLDRPGVRVTLEWVAASVLAELAVWLRGHELVLRIEVSNGRATATVATEGT